MRADKAVAGLFPQYSRSRLQLWMREGSLTADGQPIEPSRPLTAGALLRLDQPSAQSGSTTAARLWKAESIPLSIIYEDAELLVVDKPCGLVVHPGPGHADGTLINGLLHICPQLRELPRAGLVHRLDRDTSGLLMVAKTLVAHHSLVAQLQARTAKREYRAIAGGVMGSGGMVDAPLGRDPRNRLRYTVVESGRAAQSVVTVLQRFRSHSYIRVELLTGRTHQVRAHMAAVGHPLVGDSLYGARPLLPPQPLPELAALLRGFRRQALHARRLAVIHPVSGQSHEWQSPLPADLTELLRLLHSDASGAESD